MKAISTKIIRFYLIFFIIGYSIFTSLLAQNSQEESVDFTTSVYSGELENGFKYYIKPLENSDNKVHMELNIKSGTLREKKGEVHLAHFIEHLPISNFKINAHTQNDSLSIALIKNQIDLGGNTGEEYTRYTYSYQIGKNDFQEKGLHYFSAISKGKFPVKADIIESERGMIFEEIINRMNVGSVIYQTQQIKAAFSDCYHPPITPDSLWNHLKSFDKTKVDNFIQKWYRPDLSSLFIVGDIENVTALEKKIESQFSTPQSKKSMSLVKECSQKLQNEQAHLEIIDNENKDLTDRQEVNFFFYNREDELLENLTLSETQFIKPFLLQSIKEKIWESPKNYRLTHQLNISLLKELSLFQIWIRTELGQEARAIEKSYELLREVKFNGITRDHWSKIKQQGLCSLEKKEMASLKSWIFELQERNRNKDKVGNDSRSNLKEWWLNLSLEEFNKLLRNYLKIEPVDIAVVAPITQEKDTDYWKEQTKNWIDSVTNSSSETNFFDLAKKLKQKGFEELSRDTLEARVFKLSNGSKVILKETNSKEDTKNLSLKGFKKIGGLNFSAENYQAVMLSPFVIRNAGILDLNKFELQNLLSDTSISRLYPYVNDTESGILGNSNEEDLETFFQLLYGYLNSPRKDSLAFKSWKTREWQRYLHPPIGKANSDLRGKFLKSLNIPTKDLSVTERYQASINLTMAKAYAIYESVFKNAEDYTFLIHTSIKSEKILPLIDKYLGNLSPGTIEPNTNLTKEVIELPKAPYRKTLNIASIPDQNRMLTISYLKRLKADDWKTRLQIEILTKMLAERIKNLRETKRRAIYDSSIGYSENEMYDLSRVSITIPTLKQQVDLIRNDIYDVVQEIKEVPIDHQELEYILQQRVLPKYSFNREEDTSIKLSHLHDYHRYGLLPKDRKEIEKYVATLTPSMLMRTAEMFLKKENLYEFFGKPK